MHAGLNVDAGIGAQQTGALLISRKPDVTETACPSLRRAGCRAGAPPV